jgi:hypothetical protein
VASPYPNTSRFWGLSSLDPLRKSQDRANLTRKLNLHNAAAVTMYAICYGFADFDPPARQLAVLA